MASYKVILKPSVEKDFRSLPKSIVARVIARLEELKNEPLPRDVVKLEGAEGMYRLRVGSYRVVYAVNQPHQQVTVHYVRHRREVYRKF